MKTILSFFVLILSINNSFGGCGPLATAYNYPVVGETNASINTQLKFVLEPSLPLSGPVIFQQDGYLKIYKQSDNSIQDSILISEFYMIGEDFYNTDTLVFDLNIQLELNTTYYVHLTYDTFWSTGCASGGYTGFWGDEWWHWYGGANWVDYDWTFTTGTPLSIDNEYDKIINVYPNPCITEIKLDINEEYSLQFIDGLGNVILSKELFIGINTISNIEILPSGTYFIRLIGPTEIISRKIILK